MKEEKQRPEPMWQKVLIILLIALGLSLIPLVLLEGNARCLGAMILFVLAYIAGTFHIQKFFEKNARIALGEVDAFVRENGFIKTEYQGVRTWRLYSWTGRSRGAYSGNFKGRKFILSVYLVNLNYYDITSYNPAMMVETHVVCVDMPLEEGEKPAGLDSSYEHDKVAKRLSGDIYGSRVSKEKITAMMERMAESVSTRDRRQG